MRYPWVDEYLLNKWQVTKNWQQEWNWIRYYVGDKMFAAILMGEDNQPYYINVRLEPLEGEAIRQRYDDVIPGYYSDKRWWNSIRADGQVPQEAVKTMLDAAYRQALSAMPGKKQRETLGVTCCGTECASCPLYGGQCPGCNESNGRVCHARAGKPCAIYACAVNKHHFATCQSCDEAPCALWRATRDPGMTDEQFEESIRERLERLAARVPAPGSKAVP